VRAVTHHNSIARAPAMRTRPPGMHTRRAGAPANPFSQVKLRTSEQTRAGPRCSKRPRLPRCSRPGRLRTCPRPCWAAGYAPAGREHARPTIGSWGRALPTASADSLRACVHGSGGASLKVPPAYGMCLPAAAVEVRTRAFCITSGMKPGAASAWRFAHCGRGSGPCCRDGHSYWATRTVSRPVINHFRWHRTKGVVGAAMAGPGHPRTTGDLRVTRFKMNFERMIGRAGGAAKGARSSPVGGVQKRGAVRLPIQGAPQMPGIVAVPTAEPPGHRPHRPESGDQLSLSLSLCRAAPVLGR